MADKPIAQKLLIKEGYQCLVLNAPLGYAERLSDLPDGASVAYAPKSGDKYDFVQLFVRNTEELSLHLEIAIQARRPGGPLWLCYPKKSGAIKTDISRDQGWEPILRLGYEGVSLIAIDDTWSAMRFRPLVEIKRKGG